MEQLLAHLVGDYVLQNHWMAVNKTKAWLPAVAHVLLYVLPFLLLTQSPLALLVICGTHLLIDHFRLAQYWVDFWGTGKAGWLWVRLFRALPSAFVEAKIFTVSKTPGSGDIIDVLDEGQERKYVVLDTHRGWARVATNLPPPAPAWLGVWLLIIVDNTMHLCINYAALRWL